MKVWCSVPLGPAVLLSLFFLAVYDKTFYSVISTNGCSSDIEPTLCGDGRNREYWRSVGAVACGCENLITDSLS